MLVHLNAQSFHLLQGEPLLALRSAPWPGTPCRNALLLNNKAAMPAVAAAGSRAGSSLVLCVAAHRASQ